MKKALILLIATSVICVSISGNADSVTKSINKNVNYENDRFPINLPTESPDVNAQVLANMNQEVEKYLNFGEYISEYTPRRTVKEIHYPWHIDTSSAGDFVDWIIHVNYKEVGGQEKYFEEEIIVNPANFRDRFLEHPWHYEMLSFDTNEDGTNDLEVYYSVFLSMLTNVPESIDTKSVRTCLKVRTEDMLVRDAKLEIWSELKFNFGLIKDLSRNNDRSVFPNSRIDRILNRFLENIKVKFENIGFSTIINLWNRILNKFSKNNVEKIENPDLEPMAADDDWLAMGIGVVSPEGENIPLYYEKYLNVAKENIFAPIIFEHELKQVGSHEPLGLLFGFQAGHEGSPPNKDVAFEIDFDPAIHIRTQFIPRNAYIYYYFDTGSAYSQETRVTFTTNGFGADNVELSLIFDNTNPIAHSKNWMSFDVKWLGFDYKANKKHTVSVLVTSPSFSTKLKLKGIPTSVSCEFDADLSFTYQPGQLLDVSGTGSLNFNMNSNMDNAILYYPELSADEPKIELVKVSGIPASNDLSAHAHLYIQNGSLTKIRGEGYVDLTMSSSLGSIKAYYRKADPNDPDKLFIDVPYGIPASQRVGAEAELYMDLDDFSNINNYVYARGYRTASGNLQEISGYLPGETEPIVSITQIPAHAEGKGKLEWNKLKGYAYARRQSAGGPDPIKIDVDIGTFDIYNYFQLRDGILDLRFHLAEDGYLYFDTSNNMIADELRVTDTSTGDQLKISADNVDADQLNVEWNLDLNENPVQIEDLAFSGALSLLENFELQATYEGEYLEFDMNWVMGKEGEISLDFTQDEPIEIVVDDLFPNDPTWQLGGGVIIDQDFHFDMKWDWKQGAWGDRGEFKINEDTNDPNWDWLGITITYDPSHSNNPTYGVEIGGNNVIIIVYFEWWKHPDGWWPQIWWYAYIGGSFYCHLLWEGEWYENIHIPP